MNVVILISFPSVQSVCLSVLVCSKPKLTQNECPTECQKCIEIHFSIFKFFATGAKGVVDPFLLDVYLSFSFRVYTTTSFVSMLCSISSNSGDKVYFTKSHVFLCVSFRTYVVFCSKVSPVSPENSFTKVEKFKIVYF